jgi:hypothetical protein
LGVAAEELTRLRLLALPGLSSPPAAICLFFWGEGGGGGGGSIYSAAECGVCGTNAGGLGTSSRWAYMALCGCQGVQVQATREMSQPLPCSVVVLVLATGKSAGRASELAGRRLPISIQSTA